jgi:hypothetical protein
MAQRAGVSFEVDRLEVEDDTLVVSGFWTGVRGLRFVRPTLVSDDRRILATLEHKPWAPSADAAWTAAFPWNGDDVDADRLTLAVTPQVSVSLGDGGALAPVLSAAAPPTLKVVTQPPAIEADRRDPAPPPPAGREDLLRERDDLSRRLADAERLAAQLERQTLHDADAAQDEAARRCAAAERDRDRALQQLDEAIEAREAAVRTRARMQVGHDEALAACEVAEAELAQAKAAREEANAQRDEVLLAYRALRLQIQGEHAEQDRAASDAGPAAAPASDDEPIGVRTMPAARTVMSELQRPRREQKLVLSQFDLWIIRVLGVVAAGCFILLLFSILRVFL